MVHKGKLYPLWTNARLLMKDNPYPHWLPMQYEFRVSSWLGTYGAAAQHLVFLPNMPDWIEGTDSVDYFGTFPVVGAPIGTLCQIFAQFHSPNRTSEPTGWELLGAMPSGFQWTLRDISGWSDKPLGGMGWTPPGSFDFQVFPGAVLYPDPSGSITLNASDWHNTRTPKYYGPPYFVNGPQIPLGD